MKKLFLILLISTGCATSKKDLTQFSILPEVSQVSVNSLSDFDLAYLDRGHYLVQLEGAKSSIKPKKLVGLIFTTETLKQQGLSLNSIYLKSWLKTSLKTQGYYLERISSKSQVVLLVEYGLSEYSSGKDFKGKLYNRYLKIKALDYQQLRSQDKQEVLWEVRVSSIGPETEISKILPVLAAFVDEGIEKNVENKRFISTNDPKLEQTKPIPSAISVEEFKPTVEELNFFN